MVARGDIAGAGPPRAGAALSARGRTCRGSDTARSTRRWSTQRSLRERQAGVWRGWAPAVPSAALRGDGTGRRRRRREGGERRASPGTGGGHRERALTAAMGQHGAVPPSGTVPGHISAGIVLLPTRPLPGLALCRERGLRGTAPLSPSPPSPLPPTPHLFILLEPDPDGLHTLVVGDGSPQGRCLLGVLHPGQVGAFPDVLAPTLQGELSVPGRPGTRGALCTPAGSPQRPPRSGAQGST